MATGWPMKTTYANGDVYSASDVNDITGTINLLGSSVAYTAGKNKFINGNYFVNQRNFSSSTSSGIFFADRIKGNHDAGSGTVTYSIQQFTPGTAPVTGYEAKQYGRIVTTGQTLAGTYTVMGQAVEDVRTLAGQTATISFWAKAASGTPKIALEIEQVFGTGGSPSSSVRTYLNQVTISTSWARYSITATIPSISGKTIGTTANTSYLDFIFWVSGGSTYNANTGSIGIQSNTFDFWGLQVEQGSTATAFQTATGTIQGELAACQRYYFRVTTASTGYVDFGQGTGSADNLYPDIVMPVSMRVSPTSIDTSAMATYQWYNALGSGNTPTSITLSDASTNVVKLAVNKTAGFTSGRPYSFGQNNTTAYLGFSAEL